MHAQFDKGWLLFALLHEQKGMLNEAISGYTRFLEISKQQDPTIQNRLLQLVFKQKMAQKNMTAGAGEQSPFAQALRLFEAKNYQESLEWVNRCLEKTPADEQVRLLKINILSAMNNFSGAADTIKGWIKEKPDDQKWYHTLYLLCKNGLSHQKALALLEDIVQEHPTMLTGYLYLADLNARIGNPQTALVYHTKALEIVSDSLLKTKILFNMAQLHYAQQQFDAAEKVLEQGYALNQTFLPLLNLLAYHYATQSKNLKQAEKLIDEVLKVSTNPHFLDTKALVLYKKKQYKKALKILKAIEPQMPNDFSVLKHLAKTQYRLGNKQEAMKIINNAVKCAHCEAEKNKADFMIAQWNK
jgi:tetratricopeptide (TPR) repeat protein